MWRAEYVTVQGGQCGSTWAMWVLLCCVRVPCPHGSGAPARLPDGMSEIPLGGTWSHGCSLPAPGLSQSCWTACLWRAALWKCLLLPGGRRRQGQGRGQEGRTISCANLMVFTKTLVKNVSLEVSSTAATLLWSAERGEAQSHEGFLGLSPLAALRLSSLCVKSLDVCAGSVGTARQ